jgi:hypothetical protein
MPTRAASRWKRFEQLLRDDHGRLQPGPPRAVAPRRAFLAVLLEIRRQDRQPGFAPRQHAADQLDQLGHIVVEMLEQDRDGLAYARLVRRQVRQQALGRELVQLAAVFVDAESGAEARQHGQAAVRVTG